LFGLDPTPARLELAEANVKVAARLRPDAGETHLAKARNLYQSYRDFDGALPSWNWPVILPMMRVSLS
jgi:hypothetical protein